MSTTVNGNGNGNGNQLGLVDTSLTKVFVGGLAWETPKDALRQHFERYGHILEAVIISDKLTGRSKGYGFVTFTEAEAAAKACEDAAPLINGRRANCNLASLGAKRDKHPSTLPTLSPSSSSPPPQNNQQAIHDNITNGSGVISVAPVRWYYPAPATPYQPPPPPPHQHVPYFGFPPPPAAYVAPNMNYSQVCDPSIFRIKVCQCRI
uniref:RRM domain-containing protein n=1 Tax=Kalanchoe fedtschenkoi TaxID=63787 RepID=A0A7N0T6B1_KALFE